MVPYQCKRWCGAIGGDDAIRTSRYLRAVYFFQYASHISLAGVYIHWVRTLEGTTRHSYRKGLLSHAVQHSAIACAIGNVDSPLAADLVILAWLHRSVALREDRQSIRMLAAANELQRSLHEQGFADVLPDTSEVMDQIERGSWRTEIPEGIVDGENKTLYVDSQLTWMRLFLEDKADWGTYNTPTSAAAWGQLAPVILFESSSVQQASARSRERM